MWIFTTSGFYSITQDRDTPSMLWVKARVKGDLEKLGVNKRRICHTVGTDYAYRAKVDRGVLVSLLKHEIHGISYPNFKNAVKDHRRHKAYLDIWYVMVELQNQLERRAAASASRRNVATVSPTLIKREKCYGWNS